MICNKVSSGRGVILESMRVEVLILLGPLAVAMIPSRYSTFSLSFSVSQLARRWYLVSCCIVAPDSTDCLHTET